MRYARYRPARLPHFLTFRRADNALRSSKRQSCSSTFFSQIIDIYIKWMLSKLLLSFLLYFLTRYFPLIANIRNRSYELHM